MGKFEPPKPLPKTSFLRTEMKRWKTKEIIPKFRFLQDKTKSFQIMFHNIQSLPKHINLIRNDKCFTNSDIIILGET
ncbi:Ribosome-binding factor A [Frankliniella fusca]|uniref:Ribosome-binding factor A n=1 Tax=Frankliniella fusca TaxID=407009 RepID=A0AAE1HX63_9NEOP|nr:Ribosome-binding factor A [Frankliniella fusca]